MAALPHRQRRSAEYVRQRIHVDGSGWHAADEDVSWLSTLQEAIWEERKVALTYQRGDGEMVERTVDPLGLVAKGNVWYLIAGVDGEFRTYRVSRVQRVRIGDEPCTRPDGFDLVEHWEQTTAQFLARLPRYRMTLRIEAALVPWVRSIWRYARIEREEPADAQGWQVISVLVETEAEALAYVLGCGASAEVLEPPELRQLVIERVAQILSFYQGQA